MEFRRQPIVDCYVVALEPFEDERGFFARAFSTDEFEAHGMEPTISQVNISLSRNAGTTRGVHWQDPPHAEAKLVRCIRGSIYDVCVDVRPGSDTAGQWVGVELTADNHLALYVPPGCGHAHQTLEDDTELLYTTSAPYAPHAERGARWDDPTFGIEWPLTEGLTVSAKDQGWPDFAFE